MYANIPFSIHVFTIGIVSIYLPNSKLINASMSDCCANVRSLNNNLTCIAINGRVSFCLLHIHLHRLIRCAITLCLSAGICASNQSIIAGDNFSVNENRLPIAVNSESRGNVYAITIMRLIGSNNAALKSAIHVSNKAQSRQFLLLLWAGALPLR